MSVEDVVQLVLHERQSRNRSRYDQVAACFVDGSEVRVDRFIGHGADFARAARHLADRGRRAIQRLGPVTVQLDGARAVAELPLVIEWRVDVLSVEADLASTCRSYYRVQRSADGRWRIIAITSIYEKDTLTPAVPGTILPIDPAEFAAFRPSYRCLAWYLRRQGYDVGFDHLGDDRPDAVQRQFKADMTWLHRSGAPATRSARRRERQP